MSSSNLVHNEDHNDPNRSSCGEKVNDVRPLLIAVGPEYVTCPRCAKMLNRCGTVVTSKKLTNRPKAGRV